MIEPEVLAYIAGFFDGEGCIGNSGIMKNSGQRYLRITTAQNDVAPLELMQKYFGGLVRLHSNGTCHIHNLAQREGLVFLEAVLPYLLVKQNQAQRALEVYGGCTKK